MVQYKDIFKIKHNNILPKKGKVLISEPFLQEMCFQRSVIFLIEHNENGSMGFVLNKKTDILLNFFFEELENAPLIPLYFGGPVSSDRLFFIHSLGDVIHGSVQIDENLFFDGDYESLNGYLLSGNPIQGNIKFFIGYSGWTNNQLENEIKHDSWLVSATSSHEILHAEGETFWKKKVKSMGGSYKNWVNYPNNPLLN